MDLGWDGWFTIILFLIVFLALVKELFPPDIIMFAGASVLLLAQIIDPEEFLIGFSQDIIFTLAMLFVIARALEVNGILNVLAKKVLPEKKKSTRQFLLLLLPLSLASAILNNTPIVLMLVPLVTQWAVNTESSPSKFLIPLSYATIMGGTCSLIGTSTNLVVDSMLRHENAEVGLGFFELAYVGLPLAFVGFLYMYLFADRLLPERIDPTTAVREDTKEFISEFLVMSDCVLKNLTIKEASLQYFHGGYLVEIERGPVLIDSPSADELILTGDRLIFAGGIQIVAQLHGIEGLRSQADPHFKLDITSSHFSEIVISATSSLIGRTLREADFRHYYGGSVLAVYRQGKRVPGNVGDIVLQPGDTLMLLSSRPLTPGNSYNNDFFYIRYHEKLPLFHPVQGTLVLMILFGMILAASMGIPMIRAVFAAAISLLVTRCISLREARQSIRWNLLVLIASAFSFGYALQNTGVAGYIAEALLLGVGSNPYLLIGSLFVITLFVTEIITNNAAALLLFPVAIQAMRHSGFDGPEAIKAVAVTVAIAASCSFSTPIGYQTNTIVYGPGGYKFTDYFKIGLPLSVIYCIIATFLIPKIWPLVS